MKSIKIRNRWTGSVVFEYTKEGNTITEAVLEAIRCDANLRGADLSDADLSDANLRGANLCGAGLDGADLREADLNGVCGLNDWIKNIQIEDWPISYTSEILQIGCQRHPLDAWRNFSDAEIRAMDGRKALTFWHKWRETIFKIIEMAPAQPTKAADPVETEAAE